MNEDWEQVTPFLQDMQHCAEEDYFNPQEVSETNINSASISQLLCHFARATRLLCLPVAHDRPFEVEIIKRY